MSRASQIMKGLGGSSNIIDLQPCISRLRAEVRDPALVDEALLQAAGTFGLVRSGASVQVMLGPVAAEVASEIEQLR